MYPCPWLVASIICMIDVTGTKIRVMDMIEELTAW